MKKKILIFSAGPAGREIFQLISNINSVSNEWNVIGYVDSDPQKIGKKLDNIEVYSNENKPENKEIFAVCGIRNHKIRKKIFEDEIIKSNYKITNLIHPFTKKPDCLSIGNGNIIFGNVHISFEVNIKNFSIISNFCDLGHNLVSENYMTMMPAVVVGGNSFIGENTFFGSGVTIIDGTKIGKNCKIGMGSLITNDLKDNTSVLDFPRKIIEKNK